MAARSRDDLQDEIARQASEYVVHLYSGSMSAKDEQRLYDWLEADEAHRKEYQRMLDIWADADDLNLDAAGLIGADETRTGRHWMIAAGVAVVAVGAGLFGWMSRDVPQIDVIRYATVVGEQATIALDDGSSVVLNTDSEISVRYTEDVRALTLVKGEAFFDVASDKERPFSIDVGDRYVTAIGTEFNVYRTSGKTTVAVVEGTVAIHASEELALDANAELLNSGYVGTFEQSDPEVITFAAPNIEDFHSWRIGIVRFDDVSLRRLIEEYNRYNTRKIRIADDFLGEQRIGGVYQLAKVEAMLAGLELNYPLRVIQSGDQYVLVAAE